MFSGQFLLTELGHGIDALHLETTATLLPDGSFELNTPHERAGKSVLDFVAALDVDFIQVHAAYCTYGVPDHCCGHG